MEEKKESLIQAGKNKQQSPNNYSTAIETDIFKTEDFNFANLLTAINKDDKDDNIQEAQIDLDFLKNDYLELYDLGKLLNNPDYYLSKFKIRFMDFINVNNYFYNVYSNEEMKEMNKNKKIKLKKKKKDFTSSSKNISKTDKNSNISRQSMQNNENKSIEYQDSNISNNNSNEININFSNKDNNKDIKLNNSNKFNYQSKNDLGQFNENKENLEIGQNNDNSSQFFENNSSLTQISKNSESISTLNNKKMNLSQLSQISGNYSTLQIALTDLNEYYQKQNLREFQFKYIKKELGLEENEKMSGNVYEEFARKCFKIMMMIIKQADIKFENIKGIDLTHFLNTYIENSKKPDLKLNTDIHSIISTNLIDTKMENDIVTEFKFEIIKKLIIKYFPRNIFFGEYFENEKDINTINNEITLMAEISRNLIIQGTELLQQTNNTIYRIYFHFKFISKSKNTRKRKRC